MFLIPNIPAHLYSPIHFTSIYGNSIDINIKSSLYSHHTIMASQDSLSRQLTEGNSQSSLLFAILVTALVSLAVFLIRRQYRHANSRMRWVVAQVGSSMRRRWRAFSSRNDNNEKVESEEQTSKSTMEIFESEKGYIDRDTNSILQTLASPKDTHESLPSMQMENDTPRPSLKEVFEKKQSKSKHPKKSKSRIRKRVESKNEEEEEREGSLDAQNSLDNRAIDESQE